MPLGWEAYALLSAGLAVLLGIVLKRPHLALALALVALYNPYYYFQLQIEWWSGARIRALASVATLLVLALGFAIRSVAGGTRIARTRTPLDKWLYAYAAFPILATCVGIYSNNELRMILADLFPIAEFYGYFFLATAIIKDKKQGASLIWILLVGGAMNALALVGLYFLKGEAFRAAFSVFGTALYIRRLTDFMPLVLFPVVVAMLAETRIRAERILLGVCSTILAGSIVIGFWRSQWLGTAAATAFLFWANRKQLGALTRWSATLTGWLVAALVLLGTVGASLGLFPQSLGELVRGRAIYLSATELQGRGRQLEALYLWNAILESPVLGKGMGSTYITPRMPEAARTQVEIAYAAAHDFYLPLAGLMGLPALIMFLIAVFFAFRTVYGGCQAMSPSLERGIALGGLASTLAVAVTAAFQPSMLHFPIPAYIAVLAATAFIMTADSHRLAGLEPKPHHDRRGSSVAGAPLPERVAAIKR